MKRLTKNILAACSLVVAATAFQVALARAQHGHLNTAPVKYPPTMLGLQPGQSTTLQGWSQATNAFLAGTKAQPTSTVLGLRMDGAVIGGFLMDYSVTESVDKTNDFYFALYGTEAPMYAKRLTIEIYGFKGLEIHVGFRTDLGGTIAPIKVSRSKSGDAITLTYDASNLPISTPTRNDPPTEFAVISTNSKATPTWTGKAKISIDGKLQKTVEMIKP